MKKTLMIFLLIVSSNLVIAQEKPTDTTKNDTSDLSKFLTEENRKHSDQSRPIPHVGYKEDKKIHDPAQSRTIDINKYRPYIDNIDPDDPDLEKKYQEAKQEERIKIALGVVCILGLIIVLVFFVRKRKFNKVDS